MPNASDGGEAEPTPVPTPSVADPAPPPSFLPPAPVGPSAAGTSEATAPPAETATAGPRRRWGRIVLVALLAVAGIAATATGGITLAQDLTRKPTKAEVEAAGAEEQATRWRRLTVDEIFPKAVSYALEPYGNGSTTDRDLRNAIRVGVAPAAPCDAALDPKMAQVLTRHGCKRVLRATYLDGSGTLVTTVGVVVMAGVDQASGAELDIGATFGVEGKSTYGVRAVPAPGTLAERFGDARRQDLAMESSNSPYLFFRASGWTDARSRIPAKKRRQDFDFAKKILLKLVTTFSGSDDVCNTEGVRC